MIPPTPRPDSLLTGKMASAPIWKYVPLQMMPGWIVPTVWLAGTRLIGVVKATSTSGISWLNGGRSPMSLTQHCR
jgi:hypothetical protein